jgi:hypothetical protein
LCEHLPSKQAVAGSRPVSRSFPLATPLQRSSQADSRRLIFSRFIHNIAKFVIFECHFRFSSYFVPSLAPGRQLQTKQAAHILEKGEVLSYKHSSTDTCLAFEVPTQVFAHSQRQVLRSWNLWEFLRQQGWAEEGNSSRQNRSLRQQTLKQSQQTCFSERRKMHAFDAPRPLAQSQRRKAWKGIPKNPLWRADNERSQHSNKSLLQSHRSNEQHDAEDAENNDRDETNCRLHVLGSLCLYAFAEELAPPRSSVDGELSLDASSTSKHRISSRHLEASERVSASRTSSIQMQSHMLVVTSKNPRRSDGLHDASPARRQARIPLALPLTPQPPRWTHVSR